MNIPLKVRINSGPLAGHLQAECLLVAAAFTIPTVQEDVEEVIFPEEKPPQAERTVERMSKEVLHSAPRALHLSPFSVASGHRNNQNVLTMLMFTAEPAGG